MTPVYSVVIPVYNAEKYLEHAVGSVLAQECESSYEIILVNDGSQDGSAAICDSLAKQRSNVQVIHQVNQGVSAARNAGIAAARGEYVLFLDGDDCWEPQLLRTLDGYLAQKPDMIEFGYSRFDSKEEYPPVLPAAEVSGVTGIAYFDAHKQKNCLPIASSCTVACKRVFLQQNELSFPLGMSYGEDLTFHMHCLKAATSVFSVRQSLYRYRMNESSVTYHLTVKKMRDILISCANMYRLFPGALHANYYCMKILNLERLSKTDALQVYDLLEENRDILNAVAGKKMCLIRTLYNIFGWYRTSRMIRFLLDAKYGKKAI